jgi:translation initiation factor IF-2
VKEKKREEEEVVFKKEEIKIEKQVEPVIETPPPPVAPPPVPIMESPAAIAPPQPEAPELIKIDAPEIEGPKTLGKIDLSAIDSSTRPKKSTKKKAEPKVEEETPVVIQETITKQEPEFIEHDTEESHEYEDVLDEDSEHSPLIENIKAEKIEGPKILGKIDLPVDSDTRPKPSFRGGEEKRKRKRIPIDKKGDNRQHPQHGGIQNRGGGSDLKRDDRNRRQDGAGAPPSREGRPALQIQKAGDNRGGGGQQHGRTGGRNDRRGAKDFRREEKEIDQKEIQEKIRETQAKLAGSGGRGKSLKAKHRREKRQEMADAMGEMTDDNKLQVTEFVTVSELANLMDVSFTEVISKCMSLGIMVSINQRLDAEVIELVASEFGFEVEFTGLDEVEEEEEEIEDIPEELVYRPPVVTIMGHVDHGKTSLLDYIRSANVVAGEAGGITQHIGAYQVSIGDNKRITFLDTPGHEAFTAMRARGAKAADIAVIVIAADDAVMPQTKEAISHAQAAGLPMIFAINKIDKDGANPTKIYEQLSQMNILVEEWGGKYQSQELSAKKGLNVNLLLEKNSTGIELLDLKANPEREATGTIIEASLDKGRGYIATVLVQNGTLKQGDLMVSGQYYGRIKAMFNERNQRSDVAPPSTPVQILGLNGAPQAGEKFKGI